MGFYTHTANSYHCYPESVPTLMAYYDRIYNAKSFDDLCYRYEGEWDRLMEEERPAIAEQVRILREQEGM